MSFLGEDIAKAIFMTLAEYHLEERVFGALADTMASNFGQWRGAITILQVRYSI